MLTFLRKAFGFVVRPSHSRTLGLVLMLVLVAAVSLTVYVAQQQQETRQRAAEIISFNQCFQTANDEFEICKTNLCGESEQPIDNVWLKCVDDNCVPPYRTKNIYCYSLLSQTPTPTSTQITIANTPTPISKKTAGQTCYYADECATGLTCEIYEEVGLGYGQCVSAAATPTPTPTPFCAAPPRTCDSIGTGLNCIGASCGGSNCSGSTPNYCLSHNDGHILCCSNPPPTLPPTQCAAQNGQCTSINVSCSSLGSYVYGGYGSPYCSDSTPQCCVPNLSPTKTPTPTPTKTPTPTPTPKIVAPIPTGPIKCGTGFNIYYCDQGFSCGGATDNICIQNTPTPTLTPTPTPTPAVIACRKSEGDADCDDKNGIGKINDADYEIWKTEFINGTGTRADFDGDGKVTILDFNIWYQFRGT